MFGEWDGCVIVFGGVFLLIYGVILLFRRLKKNAESARFQYKCAHDNEPNHDRIMCYTKQSDGIIGMFIVLAILSRH
jgi:hypothetical protein